MLFLADHNFRQHAIWHKSLSTNRNRLLSTFVCTVVLAGRIGDTWLSWGLMCRRTQEFGQYPDNGCNTILLFYFVIMWLYLVDPHCFFPWLLDCQAQAEELPWLFIVYTTSWFHSWSYLKSCFTGSTSHCITGIRSGDCWQPSSDSEACGPRLSLILPRDPRDPVRTMDGDPLGSSKLNGLSESLSTWSSRFAYHGVYPCIAHFWTNPPTMY